MFTVRSLFEPTRTRINLQKVESLLFQRGRALLGGIIALGILTGCGSDPTPPYIGTWVGSYPIQAQPGVEESTLKTAALVQLTISPDSHFLLYDSGVPRSGDYDQFGDHGTLTTKKVLGKPIEVQPSDVQAAYGPIKVVLMKDGNLNYLNPKGYAPGGLELHRLKPGEPSIKL